MLKSLVKCLKVPIDIKPFDKYDGYSVKSFKATISTLCHPLYETTVVRNKAGAEIVSNLKLFVNKLKDVNDIDILIAEEDVVTFNASNYDIKALNTYYDFKGQIDYWVVYL